MSEDVCPARPKKAAAVAPYLVEGDDLAIGFLDLPELHEKVPESRLCNDIIRCENSHAVELRCGVCLTGQVTPNDLVLCEAT